MDFTVRSVLTLLLVSGHATLSVRVVYDILLVTIFGVACGGF